MEGHGVPGEIQITENTRNLISDLFEIQERGFVEIKGKGLMKTFLLKGRKGNTIA
ncbi:MAG: adenylate/guanylate cyclase domain-containing protein [Planctomycetia bacterium]